MTPYIYHSPELEHEETYLLLRSSNDIAMRSNDDVACPSDR